MNRFAVRDSICLAVAFLGWACAVPGPVQARSRSISFRTTVEVPDEGVRLLVPQGAQAVGLGSPQLYTYRNAQGQTFEMQAPRDFWYPTQFRGRWEDQRGTRITLAVPTHAWPSDWPREHVTHAEYLRALETAEARFGDETLAAWAEAFAEATLSEPPRDMQAPPRLSRARLFLFQGTTPQRLGVAFSFQTNPFRIDPDRWFFVLMEFERAVDLAALERDISRGFLPGLSPFAPRATSSTASERFQLSHSTPAETERSAFLEASRQRAIHSIRGLRNWWYVETRNYVIVSDLPAGRASLVRRIQADVETLRAAFETLIPPHARIEAVSVIRIFSDGAEYVAHVGSEWAQSGGAWMPGRGEMVIRPREWGSVQEQRAWLFEVVYHEAFHQYLHYAVGGKPVSVWFNEGHACFVEGAEVRGERIRFHEVPRYAEIFSRLISDGRVELESLLTLSYADFYAGGMESYARAWALVYYLRKHAGASPDHPHAGLVPRYLRALAEGANPAEATRQALNGQPVRDLEAALIDFWQSSPARRAAQRFDPLSL